MKKTSPAIVALGVSFFFLYHVREEASPQTVRGTVVSAVSQEPLKNAFVHVIEGEEEALTDAKGHFKLETFQPFPVTITVQRENYRKTKLRVAAPGQKLVIAIQPDN